MKRAAMVFVVFATAMTLRVGGSRSIGPYDDLYHLKRIAYSAEHFPHVLAFDADRDAWCLWPPLYDLGMAAIARVIGLRNIIWIPPIAFSLFAALLALGMARRYGDAAGWIAGLGAALAPYLINISSVANIDHHWTEPMFVVAMLAARRRRLLLALAMTAALFVQPALIIACGLLFVAPRDAAIAYALTAAAVIVYRLTNAYPDNGWFLGWPHAALLAAAAVALLLKPHWYAIPIGAAVALPWLPEIVEGMHFLRGDRWLQTIVEFQPLFHDPKTIGTDIANIGGGVIALLFARRRPVVTLFAIAYLVLAISSQRFLVPGIVMFVIAGAVASVDRKWIAALLTLLPPLCYDAYAIATPASGAPAPSPAPIARRIAPLPPGRVLAPWYMGHAIDVLGHHAVVIDNFGTMPNPTRFELANEALANPRLLRAYCRLNHVRYVVMHGAIWTMN